MRFGRQVGTQLHVPCQPNRLARRMFRQPAIIVPAALAQTVERGGKPHQRHEQYVRGNRFGIAVWLEYAEWAGDKVALPMRVAVAAKGHVRIARSEMGQGDGVSGIVKEPGIAVHGRFVGACVIQADHRFSRNARSNRRGRAMEQQRPDRVRLRRNVRLPSGAQSAAEVGF